MLLTIIVCARIHVFGEQASGFHVVKFSLSGTETLEIYELNFISKSMNIESDGEKRILAYIESNPNCKTKYVENVNIHDEKIPLDVYRLPTNMIFFNIRNGRFAAEYRELLEKENIEELDSKNPDDAEKIQEMLLNLDEKQTNILMEDIVRMGQKDPGIATHDGFLINGNRRMAVLNELKKKDDKYGYILVSILPKNIDHKDLWKIEANLQLSRNEKLDYGPINTLLKLKEGVDAGMTESQIARTLYGGFTEAEIREKLSILTLMEQYLETIGKPSQYKRLENSYAHFVEVRNTIEKAKKLGISGTDILKVQKMEFELIAKKTEHRDLRKMNDILESTVARKKIFDSEKFLIKDFSKEEITDTPKDEDDERLDSSIRTSSRFKIMFYEALDVVKAEKDEGEPSKLLRRALTNLQAVDPESLGNKVKTDPEIRSNMKKLIEILETFKKKIL